MPKSHERILRRIIRRFGNFPTTTYSNRISNDANVRITYEERSGRVFNLKIKRAPNLSDVSPYVGVRLQIYGRVTGALATHHYHIYGIKGLFFFSYVQNHRCNSLMHCLRGKISLHVSIMNCDMQ